MTPVGAADTRAGTGVDALLTPVRLPPGPRLPAQLQRLVLRFRQRRTTAAMVRRHGGAFTTHLPGPGPTMVVADPELAREVFLADPAELGNAQPNLGGFFGAASVFSLDGAEHRRRRNLLSPLLHGKSVCDYEDVVIEETLRETAGWPTGAELATLPSMTRITLNVILRAVFGTGGAELDELRSIVPGWMTLVTRLMDWPVPARAYGRLTPWGRLAELRHRYDTVLDKLIDDALADPQLGERTDVLAALLRSSDDGGQVMSRREIADETLTLLSVANETTAASLAWVFERLSRRPQLLDELAAEADTDEGALRRSAIREVQRTRTVVDFAGRRVYAPVVRIGEWVIPRGYTVAVSIAQIHRNAEIYQDPDRFDPRRFLAGNPLPFAWIPYGGGSRRCPGASFANLEMDVVLRTVLRTFVIQPTAEPGEKWRGRGLTYTPKDGGRIAVQRRNPR